MGRLLIVSLALVAACHGRDDLDGKRRPIPGLSDRGDVYSVRPDDARKILDLLDNRAAAVVHGAGTLTIEFGTADVAKYVDGAYRSAWHLAAEDGGRRVALVAGLAGELYFPLDTDPHGARRAKDGSLIVWMRARAAKSRQLVSVFMNEKRLGDIPMPTTEWHTYSIRAPADTLVAGENKLRFYFRHTGEIDGERTAAAIQRIGFGGDGLAIKDTPAANKDKGKAAADKDKGKAAADKDKAKAAADKDKAAAEQPVVRAESVTRGQKHLNALRTRGPARLSYYVQVPAGDPALIFAVAGSDTGVSVQLKAAGMEAATLWQGTAGAEWLTTRIELADWAGDVVRLDLVSAGPVDWGRPQLVVPASRAPAPEAERPPADHVIVWVVSALRADRLGGTVPTPNFELLAGRGARFTNAYTAAPAPAPAHVAMLSGQNPQRGAILPEAKTLGERFGEAGYITALISGNGFVNDEAGFAQGFSIYHNPMRLRHPFRARFLWQRARRILQKHKDGHTFLYLVTVEPHLPYNPTSASLAAEWDRGSMRFAPTDTIAMSEAVAAGKEHLSREEQAYVQALYNAEVRDADAAFAQMLADLDELGVADRTAVILAGDHGEELWERGGFGHGQNLYQEVLKVPLVVAPPHMSAPLTVERAVSLVDVYATALALAGISVGPDNQGANLLDTEAGVLARPVFAHLPGRGRSLILGRYKLIVPLRGQHELYDLVADPDERRNLMGQRPIVERYMRNVFGLEVAYQSAWSRSRWGRANNMSPAFAADHGL